MSITDLLEPAQPDELVPLLLYARRDRVVEAQEMAAQWVHARSERAWTALSLRSLVEEVSVNAERVLLALGGHGDRWTKSSQIAEETGLTPKAVGAAVAMIRREAAARELANPVIGSLRRGADGIPARYLRLREGLARLLEASS